MKCAPLAVALALACGSASAANLGALDLSTGSSGLSNTPIAGGFTDTYTFTVVSTVVANGGITTAANGLQDVDFTSIFLSGPSGVFNYSQLNADPVENWSLPSAGVTLAPGVYTLSLNGTNSAGIGSYGGDLAVNAGPNSTAGPGGDGGGLDLSTGSTGFSGSPEAGAFVDTYFFTVTNAVIANSSILSSLNGSQDIDFASIVISGPSGVFNFSLLNPDPTEVWALPGAGIALNPGVYTMTLTGTNSAGGGSYGGNFALSLRSPPAAVPEPASGMLVLSGLGVAGMLLGRRRAERTREVARATR